MAGGNDPGVATRRWLLGLFGLTACTAPDGHDGAPGSEATDGTAAAEVAGDPTAATGDDTDGSDTDEDEPGGDDTDRDDTDGDDTDGGDAEDFATDDGSTGGASTGAGSTGSESTNGETDGGETTTGGTGDGPASTGSGTTLDDETATSTTGSPEVGYRVFVTSTAFQGDEVANADAHCQDAADDAGLTGEWVAWVSTADLDAIDALTPGAGPYIRADQAIIAVDNDDLVDGGIDVPIDLDEYGDPVDPSQPVWTGTDADGMLHAHNCINWVTGNATEYGRLGYTSVDSALWTSTYQDQCDTFARLYCFER
ncbi:MAG: hypothetical protein AAF721_00035 [Myxococcota bacterium]